MRQPRSHLTACEGSETSLDPISASQHQQVSERKREREREKQTERETDRDRERPSEKERKREESKGEKERRRGTSAAKVKHVWTPRNKMNNPVLAEGHHMLKKRKEKERRKSKNKNKNKKKQNEKEHLFLKVFWIDRRILYLVFSPVSVRCSCRCTDCTPDVTCALTLTCCKSLVISSHDESQAKIVIHRRDSFVMVAEQVRFAN